MDYVYDTAGRRISTTVSGANGIVSKTSYTYDVAGNITALRNRKADDTLLSEFIYTYDAEGNVLSEYDSTTGKTTNYAYDILGRLVSEIGGGTSRYYTYDAAGNRIKAIVDTANTIQYTYDSDGRLTSETQTIGQTSTVINYTYDANGNLIKKKEGTKSTTYAFDVWGNMISAAGASYTYNAQGLRISKTVNKKKTSFTHINGKVWSDGTYKYVWGAELITNGSVYYLYNAHGDVVQLLNSSGVVTKTYDYEAYGNELTRDAADTNPFRYCGEYYDVETGFIYLRARYYDPSVGRFISQDPAKDGLNWYAYCNNNPVVLVDRNGLWPEWASKALAIAAIGTIAVVSVVAVVATAGAASVAVGAAATTYGTAAFGATAGATIGTVATYATTATAATTAAFITVSASSDMAEVVTGENYVCDTLFRGNRADYEFYKGLSYVAAAGYYNIGSQYCNIAATKEEDSGKIYWGSWNDYEHINIDNHEYAIVGNRLYSWHAVERLQPSGNRFGNYIYQASNCASYNYGRGIAPTHVEYVIQNGIRSMQENGNYCYSLGSVQVITNSNGYVVTVMTR